MVFVSVRTKIHDSGGSSFQTLNLNLRNSTQSYIHHQSRFYSQVLHLRALTYRCITSLQSYFKVITNAAHRLLEYVDCGLVNLNATSSAGGTGSVKSAFSLSIRVITHTLISLANFHYTLCTLCISHWFPLSISKFIKHRQSRSEMNITYLS